MSLFSTISYIVLTYMSFSRISWRSEFGKYYTKIFKNSNVIQMLNYSNTDMFQGLTSVVSVVTFVLLLLLPRTNYNLKNGQQTANLTASKYRSV